MQLTRLAALVVVLVTAGCGTTDPGSDGEPRPASQPPGAGATPTDDETAAGTADPDRLTPGPTPATPSPVRPVETTPPAEDLTLPPPAGVTRVVVRGTVSEGVEAGCLILGEYQLVATAPAHRALLHPGARVEVTGWVDRSILSFCQQGTPFRVSSARPL